MALNTVRWKVCVPPSLEPQLRCLDCFTNWKYLPKLNRRPDQTLKSDLVPVTPAQLINVTVHSVRHNSGTSDNPAQSHVVQVFSFLLILSMTFCDCVGICLIFSPVLRRSIFFEKCVLWEQYTGISGYSQLLHSLFCLSQSLAALSQRERCWNLDFTEEKCEGKDCSFSEEKKNKLLLGHFCWRKADEIIHTDFFRRRTVSSQPLLEYLN